jgi:hypothetical protein
VGEIRNLKLELLRWGPAHNQLLSPLTPYLALCGADGPVTVNLPFEHAQLLARLERLRYIIEGDVGQSQREAELRELGTVLGRVLSQVPALLSEISSARRESSELVHLRLSVSAYELALVPFELAIGADGFPGSGSPLFLQSSAPIAITREIRRGRPLEMKWNRRPRILFAFASPANLPRVPAQEHLQALRAAILPWIKWQDTDEERVTEVMKHLTVLPNATLQQIREACSESVYTHVHILAHGQLMKSGQHFGIALCDDNDANGIHLVDGETLATALTTHDSLGSAQERPTVVTLSTCDSGNVESVVTGSGSVAHAIHASDIPWVIASQFPLWMRSSWIATEVLYRGLLRGDDPRWVLHTLRRRLRTDAPDTHDWASIVAYAVVPWDFGKHVEAFQNRQTRERIETKFDEADQRLRAFSRKAGGPHATDLFNFTPDATLRAQLEKIYTEIRHETAAFREAPNLSDSERAERLGMSASSEKRIGDVFKRSGDQNEALTAYVNARELYRKALDVYPVNHWVTTQFLSMLAVVNVLDSSRQEDINSQSDRWRATQQIAQWDLDGSSRGEPRAWALGTLAELELLGAIFASSNFDRPAVKSRITRFCKDLWEEVGKDAFPVASTRRQFLRYRDIWQSDIWKDLAQAGIDALPEGESWSGRAYVRSAG